MNKFIPVFIFVMPLVVSAADWGTSQKGVVRDHSESPAQQSQVKPESRWGTVDGSWQHFKNGIYTNIGQATNKHGGTDTERLAVGYGKYGPTVAWIKIMENPWFEMNVGTLLRFNKEQEIIINGQRLIAKGELKEQNSCETMECVNEMKAGKRLATYTYTITIQSDDANDYAYRVLKSNNKINLSIFGNKWAVNTSAFNAADAKHSTAY
ncbi:hypothetical protein NE43_12090 [Salmonella enterica]|nr:hypothetical protein [Salmonella enterica]EBV5846148.1 hypothetical protein [Salmonella enterica subsp. enterica serovar Livingstone]EBC8152921.1 hypothetical protein [Salmonella enterica]ECS3006802.1 hypothetical protein [Salmonella enterica subsp. enterica serovar Livingstone]ECS5592905.1 hypothetical protein [Salmonella enterica subsp. enterica serovar Livingstone]